MSEPCVLREGIFGRWFIFSPERPLIGERAWSGSQWVMCSPEGVPLGVQVCNFETRQDAVDYCHEMGLEPRD
jgi:hypothetical protein